MKTQGQGHVKTADWRDATASQGKPKIARKLLEARKRQGRIALQILEGARPCSHLDFRLRASRTVRNYISVVVSHLLVACCYSNPRKLT